MASNDETFKVVEDRQDIAIDDKEDVIKMDEDTEDADLYEGGSLYPYSKDVTYDDMEVDVSEERFAVFQLARKVEAGTVILNPDFQRHLIWKEYQGSRFIESIILNFPLMPMYLNRNKQGQYVVVDGIQRITSLITYLKGEYALQGLEALTWLNGKKFDELDQKLRTRIEDRNLPCYVIKANVRIGVIYDIFKRINSGGTSLNRQEIRNCIYLGKGTRLLGELASSAEFIKVIDSGISELRMKDQEAVLRYLAFNVQGTDSYKGDMDAFLGDALIALNGMEDGVLKILKADFLWMMDWIFKITGKDSFRIASEGRRGRINIAVLESYAMFVASKDDPYLEIHQQQILANYHKLTCNEVYLDAVRTSTSSKKKVDTRFQMAKSILGIT